MSGVRSTAIGRSDPADWTVASTLSPPPPEGQASLPAELAREALGSFILFAFGGGSELFAHSVGHGLRTPIVAAGFGIGRVAAAPVTRGPTLRINPASSLLSRLCGEIGTVLCVLSVLVQLVTMTAVGAGLVLLSGSHAEELRETTTSDLRTAVVVFILGLVWFAVLVRRPSLPRLGIVYVAIHLVGLPLGGSSLNLARTVAPVLLTGRTAHLAAFAVPPVAAACTVALVGRICARSAGKRAAQTKP